MEDLTLQEIAIKSCKDMYEQMDAMQRGTNPKDMKLVSMIINDVRHVNRKGNYLKITLTNKVVGDLDEMGLHIEGVGNFFNEVIFDDYDEGSLTVSMYPTESLMKIIDEHKDTDLKVIYDMKWLIELTERFITEYGESIAYPPEAPSFCRGDYEFPNVGKPTEEQRRAVDTILNSKISYVWGAPGTGKTQFVMATAILAHIRKGGRVAVIAPTNNAVEQVLRGIMKVIEEDDPEHEIIDPPRDILRLGTATSEFIHDYKDICEDRAVIARIKSLQDSNEVIANVIYERLIEVLKSHFSELEVLYEEEYDHADYAHRVAIDEQIHEIWTEIRTIVSTKPELAGLVDGVDETNLRSRYRMIFVRLMERDRKELDILEYRSLSEEELLERMEKNRQEIEELMPKTTDHRIKHVKVMAMTPFILMGRSNTLLDKGGILEVSQIFIDEAGYSNLIQSLPVFSLGKPVAMLGDHMQLPPVCELEYDDIKAWCTEENEWTSDGYMKYSFMWDQSIIHVERYLSGDIDGAKDDYLNGRLPQFKEICKCELTQSHRFADNLARILDRCVYHNGIRGHDKGALQVICVDAVGSNAETRDNPQEAEAIKAYLSDNEGTGEKYAILTPYKDQRKRIKSVCKDDAENVLTVHGSQGREWDTVILSVSDNRNSNREVPLRFTSCISPNVGMKVINTAVSRAKKKLVIVCDYEFWKGRADLGDLLGLIVADKGTQLI